MRMKMGAARWNSPPSEGHDRLYIMHFELANCSPRSQESRAPEFNWGGNERLCLRAKSGYLGFKLFGACDAVIL